MRRTVTAMLLTAAVEAMLLTACSSGPVHVEPSTPPPAPAYRWGTPDEYNDGMLTTDPSASVGNYPPSCYYEAYCVPGLDSLCTILHVAIDIDGSNPDDVADAMAASGLAWDDRELTDCPQWRYVLDRSRAAPAVTLPASAA